MVKERNIMATHFIKWFGRIVSGITVAVLLIGMVFTILKLSGIVPYVVLSSSMEPTVQTGSVLFADVKDKDPEVGDIITFRVDGVNEKNVLVSHRVIEIQNDAYVTKGDNNDTQDLVPVAKEQIVGTYRFHIPKLGYLMEKLTAKVLMVIAGWLVLLNIFSIVLGNLFSENREGEDKKELPDEKKNSTY